MVTTTVAGVRGGGRRRCGSGRMQWLAPQFDGREFDHRVVGADRESVGDADR